MSTYKLTVRVDPGQATFLKQQGYSLFLAKFVQGQGQANVIWSSNPEFLTVNKYSWHNEYSVCGIASVKPGSPVTPATETKPIDFGQEIEIGSSGIMNSATGGITSDGFMKFTNKCPDSNYAAALYAPGPTENQRSPSPFYISKVLEHGFDAPFKPINRAVLWFGDKQEAGTIIAEYSGPHIVFQYDNSLSNDLTISWTAEGNWHMG